MAASCKPTRHWCLIPSPRVSLVPGQLPKRAAKTTRAMPVINPNAAGAGIGATEIFVAVPEDRDEHPVRCLTTFTQDLPALADWLQSCGIQTITLESTGVYWIPLCQILEGRGLDVCLVNSRHIKNVPGRKSDVADCQWLQYLHAVGLLWASFRPPHAVCAVRALLRHRDMLVTYAAAPIQHMQKALMQMNLQLHHSISDLTGKTGLAILDAILAGERDSNMLAQLRDFRIKASAETIAKARVGDWRDEHLFTLRQALAAYRHYQQLITDGDHEIERLLGQFDSQVDPAEAPLLPPTTTHRKPQRNEVRCAHTDLRTELCRILGVDLTPVPGLQTTLSPPSVAGGMIVLPAIGKCQAPNNAEVACPGRDNSSTAKVRQQLQRGAPWSANFNLLCHLDHHEILADLDGSLIRLARRRDQIVLRRDGLDDVRIHRQPGARLGEHLSGLFRSDMVLDHCLGSLGTHPSPLERLR